MTRRLKRRRIYRSDDALSVTGLAARPLGIGLRRPFGERGGLTSGLPAGGVEFGAGLVELALEAFVVPSEAFIVPAELLVVPSEVFEEGAEFLEFPEPR